MNIENDDGEDYIRTLLDRTKAPITREDAADCLMWYPTPQACQAMHKVILDDSEDSNLREQIAGCLGAVWAEIGYDENDLSSTPDPYRSEILRNISLIRNTETTHDKVELW